MLKKVLCILVCIGLLGALLTGCGTKEGNAGTSEGQTTGQDVTNNVAGSTEPTIGADGKKDYGVVKILLNPDYDTEDLGKFIDYVYEKSGVKVEPVWSSPSTDKFLLMVAAGETIDSADVPLSNFATYQSKKIIVPVDEYLEKVGPNIKKRVNPDVLEWVKKDGKIYGLPSEQVVPITTAVAVRKDWLDALGLGVPATYDELENALVKMKEKYNVAPVMMEMRKVVNREFDVTMGGAFLPEGYTWWKGDDGKYYPPELHPEYKNIIETMNRWYTKGLISPESIDARKNFIRVTSENLIGCLIGSYGLPTDPLDDLKKKVPEAEFVYCADLKGKYDNGFLSRTDPIIVRVIGTTAKNPEGVIRLLDWMCEDLENMITCRQGIPNVHWEYTNKNGPKPTNFANPENTIRLIPQGDKPKFKGGTFEFLDINNFFERVEVTEGTGLDLYYDCLALINGKVIKGYRTFDDVNHIGDVALTSSTEIGTCKTALEEALIAFVTGTRPMSEWEAFTKEYLNMGMQKIVDEKTEIYKSLGK